MVDADGFGTRGIVEVAGPDARALLQRLVTNDVDGLAAGQGRYAALLSPQGKILIDFFVVSAPTEAEAQRFLLDCPAFLSADLAKKLTLYRLRAKVTVADRSDELTAAPVAAESAAISSGAVVYRDPRQPTLGFRAIGPRRAIEAVAAEDYQRRRIAAAAPEGGRDFPYGDTFPHEANLDRLAGVDFTKGCYVGQEVVSRMQHRSTTRKRVTPFATDGEPPASGTEVLAGDLPVGVVGTVAADRGLALVRLDRVADANATGTPLRAAGSIIRIETEPAPAGSSGSS